MNKEIERCENCKRKITNKMKEDQHVIYASAEHTLDSVGGLGSTDDMFGGVFCSHECYNEISGINHAYNKAIKEVLDIVEELYRLKIEYCKKPETEMNKALVYLYEEDRDNLKVEIKKLKFASPKEGVKK